MAIVVTPVQSTNNYKSWNVTALDADTTLTFAHGFGSIPPDFFMVTQAISQGVTNTSTFGLTASGANLTLTKQNATGSGGASAGVSIIAKVWAWLPHSAVR